MVRDALLALERQLLDALQEAGVEGLRPTHNAVLRFLDEHGTHASELARRSGLTRQALTQIVDDLEELGYVTRRDDPSDRRAKLVVYTERGREGFRASRSIIAALEQDAERRLGRERYSHLRQGLAVLAEDNAQGDPAATPSPGSGTGSRTVP